MRRCKSDEIHISVKFAALRTRSEQIQTAKPVFQVTNRMIMDASGNRIAHDVGYLEANFLIKRFDADVVVRHI